MAPSRARARQSGATATQRRVELPPYEPLSRPLSGNAQRAIGNLLVKHSTRDLDEHLKKVISTLGDNVMEMGENYANKQYVLDREKGRYEKRGTEDEAEEERLQKLKDDLEAMQTQVDKMNKTMEDHVRKMIDGQAQVTFMSDTIKEISVASEAATGGQATATQRTRSQRRPQDSNIEATSDEEADASYQDFMPTDPAASLTQTQPPPTVSAPSTLFKTKMDLKRDRYTATSLRARYAANNDYKRFKKQLHESPYIHTEAPPMPHERTWFADPVAQPGMTTRAAADEEDDDDIAIQRETISTKCPLTLREFVDPVTSTKCPHSFEREAIEGLIAESGMHVGGARNGPTCVQCPVPGCSMVLSARDLGSDALLKRKIERLQRAQRLLDEQEEESDDGARDGGKVGRAVEIGSGAEDEEAEEEVRASSKRLKMEASGRGISKEL